MLKTIATSLLFGFVCISAFGQEIAPKKNYDITFVTDRQLFLPLFSRRAGHASYDPIARAPGPMGPWTHGAVGPVGPWGPWMP